MTSKRIVETETENVYFVNLTASEVATEKKTSRLRYNGDAIERKALAAIVNHFGGHAKTIETVMNWSKTDAGWRATVYYKD